LKLGDPTHLKGGRRETKAGGTGTAISGERNAANPEWRGEGGKKHVVRNWKGKTSFVLVDREFHRLMKKAKGGASTEQRQRRSLRKGEDVPK